MIKQNILTEMDGFLSKPRAGKGEEDLGKNVQVDILVIAGKWFFLCKLLVCRSSENNLRTLYISNQ